MKLHIVLAHPSPGSFNAALCDAAADEARALGHEVTVSDLYALGFNPAGGPADFASAPDADDFHYQSAQLAASLESGFAPEVAREQALLLNADCLMLQFPIWWGGPPAMLKGWIDKVSAYGLAYVDGTRFERGLFQGRRALVSVTTGGTPRRFTDEGGYGDIDQVLWPTRRLFLEYLGFETHPTQVSYAVARCGADERAEMITALRARIRELMAVPLPAIAIPSPRELAQRITANWSTPA